MTLDTRPTPTAWIVPSLGPATGQFVFTGLTVGDASTWTFKVARTMAGLGTSAVTSTITTNSTTTVTVAISAAQLAGLIGSGDRSFKGYYTLYNSTNTLLTNWGPFEVSAGPIGGSASTSSVTSTVNSAVTVTTTLTALGTVTSAMVDSSVEIVGRKDAASGYAGRDANLKIASGGIPGPGLASARGTEFRTARAAWANRASAPFNILMVGDSIGQGYYASSYATRWFQVMMARIQTANGQTPDIGYVPAVVNSNTVGYTGLTGSDIVGAGTANIDLGLGYSNRTLPGADTTTFQFPSFTCDRIWTVYPTITGLGTLAISYDGGGSYTHTVSEGAATSGGRIKDSGALALSARQLTVKPNGASNVRVEGAYFFNGNGGTSGTNGAGVRGWNGSHFGYNSSDFAVTGASAWWTDGLDSICPHLVFIALGTNDIAGGQTSAQYQTNIGTIISRINTVAATNSQTAPSIVVVVPYGTGATSSTATAYQRAARAAALAAGVAYVDWSELFGYVGTAAVDDAPTGSALMSSSDASDAKKHPSTKGHALLGEWMADYVLRMVGTAAPGFVVGPSSVAASGNIPTYNSQTPPGIQDSLRAFSTDGTMAGNSNLLVPTQAAVVTYAQPKDTDLTAIAALTSAADKVPYATGAGTWALADLSAAGRALIDDADATAQRATLSVPSIAASTGLVDAAGDLLVGSAADTLARLAAGTPGQVLAADDSANKLAWQAPVRLWNAPTGAITQSYDRSSARSTGTGSPLSTGRITCVAVPLSKGQVVSTISFLSGTTALVTGANQWFGIADSSRVVKAVTNDDTSTAWGASTVKTLTLTAPFTVTSTGLWYLFVNVTAATVPTLCVSGNSVSTVVAQAPILTGSSTTGQTTPIALETTLTALTANADLPFAYAS